MRRRHHGCHGLEEVLLLDHHLVRVYCQLLGGGVDLRVATAESVQSSLSAHTLEIRSAVADGLVRDGVECLLPDDRVPLGRVQLEDVPPRVPRGQREAELAVEAAGAAEGGIDVLDAVCGACIK